MSKVASEKIEDFGEKIGGARKDIWRSHHICMEDIQDLTEKEILNVATKKNIWVQPEWQSLKGTKPNEVLYAIKLIREKLPATIRVCRNSAYASVDTLRRYALEYTRQMQDVMDYCENNLNSMDDVKNMYRDYLTSRGYLEDRVWTDKINERPCILNKQFLTALSDLSLPRAVEGLTTECMIQNFPDEFRSKLKGTRIGHYPGRETYTVRTGKYGYCSKLEFLTIEEGVEYVRRVMIPEIDKENEVGATTRKSTIKVVRPQLARIVRNGPDVRGGMHCSPEDMLELFKFRGGEFGNWNNNNDRQQCLDYAYDAFNDLAYALDLPLDGMSL